MSTSDLQIRQVEKAEYPKWRAVLAAAPEGTNYQLPEYLAALSEVTGGSSRLLGIFRGKTELLGGIGLYLRRTRLGTAATSRLLLYYNGPFLEPAPSNFPYRRESYRRELLEALEAHLRTERLEYIRFKSREVENDYRPFIHRGWRAEPFYSYEIPLRDLESQWSRVDKNLRRLIRRGRDCGLTFTEHGDFDSFFDMHEEIHRRKNGPIYLSRTEFRYFIDTLISNDIGRLFQVSLPSGEPAASQLVLLGPHPVAHTLAAAAFEEHQHTGCNAFMRWSTCEWLSARGHTAVDLTDAHNPSVARFKGNLGSTLTMGLQVTLPAQASVRLVDSAFELAHRAASKLRRVLLGRK